MENEIDEFSKTLDRKHLDKALKTRTKLVDDEVIEEALVNQKKVYTVKLFQKGFKIESVANNEFSKAQLDELEIAERNLNNNIDNER